MTIISGFEINLDEDKLDKMINEQMMPVNMVDADFEGYKNLSEGDKKALNHFIKLIFIQIYLKTTNYCHFLSPLF